MDVLFDTLFWGISLGFLGKVILGATVISVHAHILKEHRIDADVLKEMKRERRWGIAAVLLIIIGYTLELIYFGFLPF